MNRFIQQHNSTLAKFVNRQRNTLFKITISYIYNIYANFVSESQDKSDDKLTVAGTAGGVCLDLLIVFVFCTLRRHKKKNRKEETGGGTEEDMNPVYGLYECDPDPHAEVEDK